MNLTYILSEQILSCLQGYGSPLQESIINKKVKIINLTKLTDYKPKMGRFPIRSITSDNTYATNQSYNSVIWKSRISKKVGTAVIRAEENLRKGDRSVIRLTTIIREVHYRKDPSYKTAHKETEISSNYTNVTKYRGVVKRKLRYETSKS